MNGSYELLAMILAGLANKPNGPARSAGFDETYNIVVDANSLFARWVAPGIQDVAGFKNLIQSTGANVGNCAIPGQTWADMTKNAADVQGLWRSGKKNILVTGETTNSIFVEGATVAKTVADAKAYIAARRASQKWDYIVMCGTIPRGDKATAQENVELNKRLIDADNQLKADDTLYSTWVDFRAFSPEWFGLRNDGYAAKFMDSTATCNPTGGRPDMIHPIGAPRDAFADAIADGLNRLSLA
nr:MAG TPA: hypothetical protein [Caudoviricetes sp.]